jgi:hypothetical protein
MSIVQGIHIGRRSRRAQCYLTKAIVEALEPRVLLSTYTVENLYDVPSSNSNYTNSLRWAINEADAAGGDQTIAFASGLTGTISLSESLGSLTLADTSGTLTIDSPGAGTITVNAGGHSGVFSVESGSVSISGLTITGGHTSGSGGGIYSDGTLTISDCTITGNSAAGNGGGIDVYSGNVTVENSVIQYNTAGEGGGGVYNYRSLTLVDCTITGNSSNHGGGIDNYTYSLSVTGSTIRGNSAIYGGGVYNDGATATITSSTIVGNTALKGGGLTNCRHSTTTLTDSALTGNTASEGGGGIENNGGTVTVIYSTLSGNHAFDGGGIDNNAGQNDAHLTVNDSTLTGNVASRYGGGIDNYNGAVTVTNSTLSGNSARAGGGIYNYTYYEASTYTAQLTVTDSTIADNTATVWHGGGGISSYRATSTLSGSIVAGDASDDTENDLDGDGFSGTYNLIGTGGLSTASSSHNQQGTTSSPINPLLSSSLGNYGGPTQTMALLTGSPAIGNGAAFDGIDTDQRGTSRPSNDPDIGAFEETGPLVVNTTADGPFVAGQLDLREAINLANARGGDQTITFASGLSSTITLNQGSGYGTLDLSGGNISIQGPGANALTINGEGHSTVFTVDSGCTATIENLKITGGYSPDNGGGVENLGTLGVANCSISGNSSSIGGGIYNYGSLSLTDCTITDNVSSSGGGGVGNAGALTISDCTIESNTVTSSSGGGITINGGPVRITDSTISGNSASSGGGVYIYQGSVYFGNSYIDNNKAVNGKGGGLYLSNGGGTATFVGCTISGNSTSSQGGGIAEYGSTGLLLTDSTVSDNSARIGGGLSDEDSPATLIDCTISGNSASEKGGGIFNNGTIQATNSWIIDNIITSAGFCGGGIYTDGDATITDCTISGNCATGNGGGLYSRGTTYLDYSTVSYNFSRGYGGGIANAASMVVAGSIVENNSGDGIDNASDLMINHSTIEDNSTIGNGGGILNCVQSGATDMEISDCTISGNSAQADGGGICNQSNFFSTESELTVSDSTISGNTAGDEGDGGGGISNYGHAAVTNILDSTTISGNHAPTGGGVANWYGDATISDSTITGNSAQDGGGVYSYQGTVSITDHATISGNTSSSRGGGLDNSGYGTSTVSDSTITGNSATSGGGVFNDLNCALTVESGSVISLNIAQNGAGIDNNRGTAYISDSTIEHNTASESGGGIYNDSSGTSLTISGSTITHNSALSTGGGVTNKSGDTAGATDSSFTYNSAPTGGAIYNLGTVTISGSSNNNVNGNSAGTGAGIYNSGEITLTGSTLSGNLALYYGGAIYNIRTSSSSQSGVATINSSTLSGNSVTEHYDGEAAAGLGGAIVNAGGSMTLSHSSLTGNTAAEAGGAVYISPAKDGHKTTNGYPAYLGNVSASYCTFEHNETTPYEYSESGGAISDYRSNLTITHSLFEDNVVDGAYADGGAIDAESDSNGDGSLSVTYSQFYDNTGRFGGAIYSSGFNDVTISGCIIAGNAAVRGAGIDCSTGVLTVANSTISGNSGISGPGGGTGLDCTGNCTVYGSLIEDNTNYGIATGSGEFNMTGSIVAGNGGTGIKCGSTTSTPCTITGCTLSGNGAVSGDQGGGISNEGPLSVVNCTISGNVSAIGGGIYSVHSPLTIVDCTISGNTATDSGKGGGLNFQVYGEGGEPPPVIEGTIISGNTGGDFYGSTYALGDDDFTGTNNVISGSALLTTLGNFGGPLAGAPSCATSTGTAAADQEVLQTMALLPGSPALGAGASFDGVGGNPVTADERNVSRTADGGLYDIGAYESEGFDVTITGGSGQSAAINTAFSSSLAVHVTANDSDLTNLSGGVVTFIAPVTGATAVLGTNRLISDSVTLNGSDNASDSATADDTPGGYNVTASATPDATSSYTNFSMTNTGSATGLPTLSISGPSSATGGLAYTLTLNTSDATQNIALTWTIHWGDGQTSLVSQNNDALSTVTHTFAMAPGNFTIFATATDSNGDIYVAGTVQVNEDNEGASAPGPVRGEAMSTNLVDLNWQSVSGALYYQVYGSTDANMVSNAESLLGDALPMPTFADDSVIPGNTYYYQVYSVNASGASTLIGASSVAVPDNVTSYIPPSPTNVQAVGVNGLEIFVSWTPPSKMTNIIEYQIEVSTNPSNPNGWSVAGIAEPDSTSFFVRTTNVGSYGNFLSLTATYYVEVMTKSNTGNLSSPAISNGATPVTPTSNDIVVIIGGNAQSLPYLMDGLQVANGTVQATGTLAGNSVGNIWWQLESDGFNAFITADPHDGGDGNLGRNLAGETVSAPDGEMPTILPDGSGQLFDEIIQEVQYFQSLGETTNIALIGYSHGGGMVYNLSQMLFNPITDPYQSLVEVPVTVTIDAVQYGTGSETGYFKSTALKQNPAQSWEGIDYNFYEPNGYTGTPPAPWVHGTNMTIGNFVNNPALSWTGNPFPYNGLNHSSIGVFQPILDYAVLEILEILGSD